MTARLGAPMAIDDLVRLEEVGERRALPRPGRILRLIETPNRWDNDSGLEVGEAPVDSAKDRGGWDGSDYLAAAGIGLLGVGLILSFMSSARAGGVLVPLGAAALAVAGYTARRKDETET